MIKMAYFPVMAYFYFKDAYFHENLFSSSKIIIFGSKSTNKCNELFKTGINKEKFFFSF